MKLRLLCVGKLSENYLREGAEEYTSRIRRYAPLTVLELKEEKTGGKKADPRYIRDREGERILEKIGPEAWVIVLAEEGVAQSSEELAGLLERHMVAGTAEWVLVIGGAYGLSPAVKQRANLLLSLSAMTLTHQLARLLLLEQIYRGFTIVRREPYHNR